MFRQYFGFSDDPFGATPDPRFLYSSRTHREALASLKYSFLSNRGFTALIAPPGMGKTTLLFRFLEEIQKSARTVFLFNIDSDCGPRELIGQILRDLGISPGATGGEMRDQLSAVLVGDAEAQKRLVVVIDEAQNLSDAALETLRLLSNFETPQAKLMQIVLAGQLQLSEKLLQPSLVQLRQRITMVCHLEPLSAEETAAYIEHRLNFVGYNGNPLFAKDALITVADATQGIPREINNVCFNALSLCCTLKRKQVHGHMVEEAISDQQLPIPLKPSLTFPASKFAGEPSKVRPNVRRLWIASAALLLLLLVQGTLRVSGRHRPRVIATHSYAQSLPVSLISGSATSMLQSQGAKATPKVETTCITVKPNQTIRKIARQYLGGDDFKRLRQIQDLNPRLTDPNHIEPGERITLPEALATSFAKQVTSTPDEENTP